MKRIVVICISLAMVLISQTNSRAQDDHKSIIFQDDFKNLDHWAVEQADGGKTFVKNNCLEIDDVGGCTVWCKMPFVAPLVIEYKAVNIKNGGPNDRVSDMNCFVMARDLKHPDGLISNIAGRTGGFAGYDSLRLYYFGYGVHDNSKTRFRRYDGQGNRPLLPEYDLTNPQFLLAPNRTYQIKIVIKSNRLQYYCNGLQVYDINDPEAFADGYFGFRTFKNHMKIWDFKVYSKTGN